MRREAWFRSLGGTRAFVSGCLDDAVGFVSVPSVQGGLGETVGDVRDHPNVVEQAAKQEHVAHGFLVAASLILWILGLNGMEQFVGQRPIVSRARRGIVCSPTTM